MMVIRVFVICLAVLMGEAAAHAAPPPDYDFDWAEIGHPGNRNLTRSEVPTAPTERHGRVDHRFRVATTELTASQWLEFLQAYWPHASTPLRTSGLLTFWVWADNPGAQPGEDPGFYVVPGAERYPVDISWYGAARYCNWLHNGKANTASAFETGAYDTTNFGLVDEEGNSLEPRTHLPGAQFWIPSIDEMTKAMFFDPDRHGVGGGGYWRYPNGSEVAPISGLPGEGGQTNAGEGLGQFGDPEVMAALNVGSYPDIVSPWGLLDASGGVREWNEDPTFGFGRAHRGSQFRSSGYLSQDIPEGISSAIASGTSAGLRLASVVPSPSTLGIALVVSLLQPKRRFRCEL